MQKTILFSAALAVAIAASGCSGGFGTMDEIMGSWMGEPIDAAINQWGYPDYQNEFNGRKIYAWRLEKSAYVPQTSTTTGTVTNGWISANTSTSGGYTIHGSCTRVLEVNQSGYIVGSEWKGNNCPFAEWFGYAKWRNPNVKQ